jgi:anti-sigma B factor antagonist
MRTASERGNEHIDLVFEVPEETVEGVRQLDAMMDTVDEYCRDGDLLTLATPPDLVEFRRWFLGEFVRQIGHGEPPRSWDSFHRGGLDTSDPPRGRTGGVIGAGARDDGKIMFEGDLDLASAGLLREEIVVRRSSGATSLVIDLTRVEFIDSVGLSLLVTAFNRAREDGAELSLVLPSHLRRVFEISGLVELLDPKFEDRPSA